MLFFKKCSQNAVKPGFRAKINAYFSAYTIINIQSSTGEIHLSNNKKQGNVKAPKTQCFRGFHGVPDTIRTCDLQSRSRLESVSKSPKNLTKAYSCYIFSNLICATQSYDYIPIHPKCATKCAILFAFFGVY